MREPTVTVQLKLRLREELRAQLEESARRSELSLNSEILRRLERSFRDDNAAGGSEQARLLETFRLVWDAVTRNFGVSWLDEPNAWDIATKAVVRMLLELQPPPTASIAPAGAQLPSEQEQVIAAFRERHDAWHAEKKGIDRTLVRNALKVHGGAPLDDEDREAGDRALARKEDLGAEPVPDLPPAVLKEWQAGEAWRDTLVRAENAAWQVVIATLAEMKKL